MPSDAERFCVFDIFGCERELGWERILAARGRQNAVIEILLDEGADPHKKNKYGRFPLGAAFRRLNQSQYQAAKNEILATVKVLIKGGASPDMGSMMEWNTEYGRWKGGSFPIGIAASYNDRDIIKVLLDAGANPNIKHSGPFGGTTLRSALYQSSLDIIKLLLEAGADPSIDDGQGRTPLTAAKSTRMAAFRRTTLAHRVAAIMQSTCKELCKVGDCPIKRCFKSDEFPLIHRMMSMAAYHQRRYKSGPLSPVPGF